MNKIVKIVGVYGTLKKGFGNHRVMESAEGKYIGDDYVEIESLGDCGFPTVKFKKGTNKWLRVELYSVDNEGIEGPLDSLEGYHPDSEWNLYNRIEVISQKGEKVSVYEIVNQGADVKMAHFEKEEKITYFNWN